MNTIKTHLPIYNGNYGTIWQDAPNEEYEVEHINELRAEKNLKPIEFDDIEFDYKNFYNELSELITNEVEFQLKDYVHSIKYLKLNSPKYYNYSNDSIECEIAPNMEAIKEYINKYQEEWSQYLKDNYTSYDGFCSFHSNDYKSEEWELNTACKDYHKLGAVLEFIAQNESIEEYDIYDSVIGNVCIDILNYDTLINN
tara:strand:- start:30 stop:623 length:594 start_codon:yes stop_codon:yes gene_type:complete